MNLPVRLGLGYDYQMLWTPLSHRINHLPLILAGPILRRTEPEGITVWLALKEACEVTLRVYATQDGQGEIINQQVMEGSRSTVRLGKYLHLVAVTAKSVNFSQLRPAQIYAYDLDFGKLQKNLVTALNSEGFSPLVTISYFSHQLPTFAMPPDNLNELRLVHGSCRKPHGGGRDALPILDNLIEESARLPNCRPHQLFFTGDQIYGDDVADPLLWAVTEAGNTLLGWEEDLPLKQRATAEDINLELKFVHQELAIKPDYPEDQVQNLKLQYEYQKPSQLKPGQRSDMARDDCGFTAMLVNKPEKAKSHLFSLGEYYAMYLFVWSPILWSGQFPKGKTIRKDQKQAQLWDKEARILQQFARDLWKVRRAMANVPTYMICDDHDISDDWYLNRWWCTRVLSQPLGRRVVQNGLLGYAVFQAWGNTPDQFQAGKPGEKLLAAAAEWSASAGTDESAWEEAGKYLGIPQLRRETNLSQNELPSNFYQPDAEVLVLDRNYPDGTQTLDWHYTVRGFKHEVLVLDTRTWRGYPKGEDTATDPPMLLSPKAFDEQIKQSLKQTDNSVIEATLVILPTNLVSLAIIDVVQSWDLRQGRVFNSDVGDSWNFNKVALNILLAELFEQRDRVVVLTGDIHYGGAVRLNYWSNCVEEKGAKNPKSKVLAQLIASSFKNEELKTNIVHTKAKSIAPEFPEDWVGWKEPPQLIEVQVIQEIVRLLEVEMPQHGPIIRRLHGIRGNGEISWGLAVKDQKSLPDWQYHIEWIKRQKAKECQDSSADFHQQGLWDIVSLLWRNRWLQEGKEVVGRNNLGMVSFQWSEDDDAKAVIQDIYWRPLWKPTSIVSSRYFVPLQLDDPPPQLRVISP